ncbi:MAG: amine oxidase [Pseudonocardiales bacterium]|nr:amine oxidase [Jatrophihabitantaceae bacterium]MCW2602429.1 amine oxidase [Pseudonocardiales bacterium]
MSMPVTNAAMATDSALHGAEGAPGGASTVVIGAGPAGLTAAYALGRAGRAATVVEASDVVGGISQTVERDGWRFDIGGHRFFTKVPEVEQLWDEILGAEEFLLRPRMSRIFYKGKLYDYPLQPLNAVRNLGIIESCRCIASYAKARVRPPRDQSNFEGWVAARFGWRLYRTFFKTYTEKVWGVDASEIQADWAAQRIKNLSLMSAATTALGLRRRGPKITSLIEEFRYPKYGPGMMWEAARDKVESMGGEVRMRTEVVGIERRDGRAVSVVVRHDGARSTLPADHVISSMPLSQLVNSIRPSAPDYVVAAANGLRYRDFLTVALVVPAESGFADNWIYIHDPGVSVGRIQNFGSWSPYMVKDGRTCLGLEYFVHEGDRLWSMPDADLIALATSELKQLGLLAATEVEAGYVVRMPKAYPTYDEAYARNVQTIRDWLEAAVPNVVPVGRNGMHRYNNADHSMVTAMLAVQNILGASPAHDLWSVNVEQDYHETDVRPGAGTGRDAPVIPLKARQRAA